VPAKRLIANVEGAMNAVLVQGDAVGATLYYGKGAGAEPTASAVIADLVDVTRLHTADPNHRVPHLAFQPDELSSVPVLPIDEVTSVLPAHARGRRNRRAGRDHAHPGRSRHQHRRDAAEGIARRRAADRHHHPDAPDAREARQCRDRSIEALQTVLSPVTRLRMEELN
jgi:homoserine dehydrogenase